MQKYLDSKPGAEEGESGEDPADNRKWANSAKKCADITAQSKPGTISHEQSAGYGGEEVL